MLSLRKEKQAVQNYCTSESVYTYCKSDLTTLEVKFLKLSYVNCCNCDFRNSFIFLTVFKSEFCLSIL